MASNGINSVIEFGSGDGAQLELAVYPDYTGVDVSDTILEATRRKFAGQESMRFLHASEVTLADQADLSLSLDAIYHLVEDAVFETYMNQLFDAAKRYVIVYSSNEDKLAEPARAAPQFHCVGGSQPKPLHTGSNDCQPLPVLKGRC